MWVQIIGRGKISKDKKRTRKNKKEPEGLKFD